jgi:hypothetical protein
MNSDLLWDWFITIKRIYTIDEKIMYVYQYFDYYSKNATIIDTEYLRHMLRQIDFKPLIDNTTTLQDIQLYIKGFVHNSIYLETYMDLINDLDTKPNILPRSTYTRDFLIGLGVTLITLIFLRYYNDVWFI